jgi:acyl carrier protein
MSDTTEDNLEGRVRSIIGDVFNLTSEEAKDNLQIGNPPQWDSIGHMQLLVRIEDEFGLRFPTYAIADLINVEAIVAAIETQKVP